MCLLPSALAPASPDQPNNETLFPLLSRQGGMWYGVDVNNEDIADNFEACVWEPAIVRINALTAASEAACLIVSVDETIKNPRSTVDAAPSGRGRGRGRPHNH